VLERLSRNFRELLKQFEARSCPLCGVLRQGEREQIEQARGRSEPVHALCGPHLEMILSGITNPRSRARSARVAIEAVLASEDRCRVCTNLGRVELRLTRAIHRLESGMRFRKAQESAPLFCRAHGRDVTGGDVAVNFAQVEGTKILHLRDALAQAELRNDEDIESLVATTLAYLGRPAEQLAQFQVQESLESTKEDTREFERWDDKRHFKRLADLESEVAGLRYRNAVLAQENHELKLAHIAGEALRHDLERDRAQLLAAAEKRNEDPLKPSNSD
jgi:hypothetical protein